MTQYGFYFDQSRCYNCHACVVACRDWYAIPPGPVKWGRVLQWEKGAFPNVMAFSAFVPCFHCEDPVCVDAANGAMYKEAKYGAVLIDPARANDPVLRQAADACPYGVIQFDSDATDASASKCTMCIDRLEQGKQPLCVMACGSRALDFGLLEDMITKYGTLRQLEDFPDPNIAKPAMIVKPRNAGTRVQPKLIPYDVNRALTLLASRQNMPSNSVAGVSNPITGEKIYAPIQNHDLPSVFNSPDDLNYTTGSGLVAFDHLVLKPRNTAEALAVSKHDYM